MIYYITGLRSRSYKIEELMKEFNNISIYDASLDEYDLFLNASTSSSIFQERELIVLKRANKLKNFKQLLNLLNTIKDDNKHIVIDYYCEYKNKNPYIKDFQNLKAEIINIENDEDIVINYIMTNLSIKKTDAKKIIEIIGTNYYMVKNEVLKYKVYLGNEKYDLDKIKHIMTKDMEIKIFDIANKILSKKINFNDIHNNMYMGILYSLQNEFQILNTLHHLDLPSTHDEFKKEYHKYESIFKVNYYSIFLKIKNYKNLYSKEKTLNILKLCLKYENDIKIGNLGEGEALYLIISEVMKNE
ncbi:DNA polymerase III subunit delta [Caviibacter abscessus]|uniref:hypothetical protein n=1 Tax=Caviibacter abscessus TaxID=1766719 RepID=UPI00082DC4F6|nr:hypothetical protein [Caviibacter abscessus]